MTFTLTRTLSALCLVVVCSLTLALPLYAFAQPTGTPIGTGNTTPGTPIGTGNTGAGQGQTLINPLKVDSVEGLLDIVVEAAKRLGAIVLILMLIWTGFLFVTARGKAEDISKARQMLLWVVIGGLILLGAEALTEVIKSTANEL